MTEREKQAFYYFYYTDMTAREVGEKLGISMSGAQSIKNKYLLRLKKNAEEIKQRLLNLKEENNFE